MKIIILAQYCKLVHPCHTSNQKVVGVLSVFRKDKIIIATIARATVPIKKMMLVVTTSRNTIVVKEDGVVETKKVFVQFYIG